MKRGHGERRGKASRDAGAKRKSMQAAASQQRLKSEVICKYFKHKLLSIIFINSVTLFGLHVYTSDLILLLYTVCAHVKNIVQQK